MDTTHQASTLAVQVGVDFLLESCLVEITATNSNTQSLSFLESLSSDVLEDGNGRVDTTTLLEEGSNGSSRALWSNKDNIDVSWNVNLGEVFEYWGESVGEIQSLVLLALFES